MLFGEASGTKHSEHLQLDIFWLENILFERFPKVMPITDTYKSTCDLAHTPQGLPN